MSLLLPSSQSWANSAPRGKNSVDTVPLEKARDHNKPQKDWPPGQFDDEGTELSKDAKFWKIYVEETDRWDAEVIDGWNRSLDVILVFAALFSAILTAFLIESSKRLQQDPIDNSAQSLLVISQTLLAVANGLPPPGLDVLSLDSTETFTPTRNAIVINTLWYLSLSISLATAFIAALAKEWCQSFLSGRTGHPCIQARRRQQKWTMIESWRMEELITLLPTLIHIALLLFSIGLCFYVGDLNPTVAIPVVCVTGTAIGFYVCSSLAASFLEFFPYQTIISKMLGSQVIRPWIIVALFLVDMFLILLSLLMLIAVTATIPVTMFCGPAVGSQVLRVMDYLSKQPQRSFNRYRKQREESVRHDLVTSQALSWMVKYCEVPNSIDITLQAIAGATRGLPLQPLEECHAALKISQRLVSSNLYSDTEEHQRHMKLYLRALAVLTPAQPQQELIIRTNSVTAYLEHLKALIWELQSQNDNSVASLMVDTQFITNDHNISALRIGSIAASQCLVVMDRSYTDENTTIKPFLQLFQQQFELVQVNQTHPASMMALLNTGSMLSVLSASSNDSTVLPSELIQTFSSQLLSVINDRAAGPNNEFEAQIPGALVAYCLLQNRHIMPEHTNLGDVLSVLIHLRSLVWSDLQEFIAFGLLEIVSDPEYYIVDPGQMPTFEAIQEGAKQGSTGIVPADYYYPINPNHFDVLKSLRTLRNVYALAGVGSPHAWAYVFVVGSIIRIRSRRLSTSTSGDITDHCVYLLSKFCFPRLSVELVEALEKRNICARLEIKSSSKSSNLVKQFIVVSQLWLLHALYLDPILYTSSDSTSLLHRYQACFSTQDVGEIEKRKHNFGEKIEELSHNLSEDDIGVGSFEIYYHRVLECVFQARDTPLSDHRWDSINQKLAGTPTILRGLGSFLQLPMRSPLAGTPNLSEHAIIEVPDDAEPGRTADLGAGSTSPETNALPSLPI
ncbi:unnamed protein product [Rhizoctonia solani]|uniref:DUF6535 domain-containing protein n=1 Tax=Rhizoctonia solani TaxID=456999 RepID=A0A8H3GK76_9AGAM|nr:unnamed protein product [Rhizoctonia solani]